MPENLRDCTNRAASTAVRTPSPYPKKLLGKLRDLRFAMLQTDVQISHNISVASKMLATCWADRWAGTWAVALMAQWKTQEADSKFQFEEGLYVAAGHAPRRLR